MPLFIESQFINDDCYLIGTSPEHRWYPVYCKPNKAKKLAELFEKNCKSKFPVMPENIASAGPKA